MSVALAPPVPTVGRPLGLTLERRLEGVLAEGFAQGETECPLCAGAMAAERHGLRCKGCGSRLS
jgi:hypothetical protein